VEIHAKRDQLPRATQNPPISTWFSWEEVSRKLFQDSEEPFELLQEDKSIVHHPTRSTSILHPSERLVVALGCLRTSTTLPREQINGWHADRIETRQLLFLALCCAMFCLEAMVSFRSGSRGMEFSRHVSRPPAQFAFLEATRQMIPVLLIPASAVSSATSFHSQFSSCSSSASLYPISARTFHPF